MSKTRRFLPVAVALLLALFTSSCFVKKVVIQRKGHRTVAGQPQALQTATRSELTERVERLYGAINSFQATVDMTPTVGSVYEGKMSEYKDVRAFVLFRKPSDIRIIGQLPVVRTKAFDMVSNGDDFRFYLVSKNLFVTGLNSAPATSKNKIENLRPSAFLSSMLIRPQEADETPVLQDLTDEDAAHYILLFIRRMPDGDLRLTRSVWFDRIDLTIVRQIVFDEAGDIVSDTRYAKWLPYNGVSFPAHIDINRPKEGYGVIMDVTTMQMNNSLADEQFVLTQPEGTTLQTIGAQQ